MFPMTSLVVTGTLSSVKVKILNSRSFKESMPSIDLDFDGWLRSAWCFLCHTCPLANPKRKAVGAYLQEIERIKSQGLGSGDTDVDTDTYDVDQTWLLVMRWLTCYCILQVGSYNKLTCACTCTIGRRT